MSGVANLMSVHSRQYAAVLLVLTGVRPQIAEAEQSTAPTQPPAYITRGETVDARYKAYKERLAQYYDRLCSQVKADAPDLYSKMEKAPPKPAVYGYGLLPKLLPAPAPGPTPSQQPRATSNWYSWP